MKTMITKTLAIKEREHPQAFLPRISKIGQFKDSQLRFKLDDRSITIDNSDNNCHD